MRQYPKTVLITAGTKRLGLRFAQTTIEMGYNVIVHYRTSSTAAHQWLHRNPSLKGRVFFIQHDLEFSPATVIKKAMELPCTLIGLVNNASLFSKGDLCDLSHLQQMMEIHCVVPATLGTCFYENIKKGWIINITDAIIDRPNLAYQNYRISKLFLRELTRQQAVRFAPSIRVNALAPGALMPSNNTTRKDFRSLARNIPLQQTGAVTSLMDAYRFLVNDQYCTGQTISVDGGWNLTA